MLTPQYYMGKVYLYPIAPNCCAAAANPLGLVCSGKHLQPSPFPAAPTAWPAAHRGVSLTGVPSKPTFYATTAREMLARSPRDKWQGKL